MNSTLTEEASLLPHPQRRDKSLLRDAHVAVLAHPGLALLLLVEQLLLAADVAAIALGGHVLAQGGDWAYEAGVWVGKQ